MKNKKESRYGNLKLILRLVTLAIAVTSLVISLQNKSDIDWINKVQDNIIENILFKTK